MFRPANTQEFLRESVMSGPIPGQSLTTQPKSLPIDRPPETVDAEQLLTKVIKMFSEPRTNRKLIGMMEVGQPADNLASTILSNMVMEGATTPQAAMVSTPAVMTVLIRMADAAGITPKLSTDGKTEKIDDVDRFIAKSREARKNEGKVSEVAKQSLEDLPQLPNSEAGLMTRPEGLV